MKRAPLLILLLVVVAVQDEPVPPGSAPSLDPATASIEPATGPASPALAKGMMTDRADVRQAEMAPAPRAPAHAPDWLMTGRLTPDQRQRLYELDAQRQAELLGAYADWIERRVQGQP